MGKGAGAGGREAAEGVDVLAWRGRSGFRDGRPGTKILPEWGTISGYGLSVRGRCPARALAAHGIPCAGWVLRGGWLYP